MWLDFSPQRGHEQAHRRPALVLSPKSYNEKAGLLLACPITSKIKGYPFEVECAGKNVQGAVLSDQIRALDWRERHAQYVEKASRAVVSRVREKILLLVS